MKNHLTPEQISFYRKNGFIIIEDFLNAEELEHWRDTIETALKERQGRKFPHSDIKTGQDDGINANAEYFGNVFKQIINLWMTNDGVKEINTR